MIFKLAVLGLMTSILVGCSATHTAIQKRHLDVQTKMSSTVFLDPVSSDKRTVYLQIRNTSDKPELDLAHRIAEAMEAKGYQLTDTLEQAHYLLQANILQVGKTDLRAAECALNQGFGAALTGAAAGAALGSLGSNRSEPAIVGGVLGASVATVADAMVQDIVYSVIADIQVSERVGNSVMVQEKTKSKLKQGTSGIKEVTATEKTNWKRYQTRIVSTANKVNLSFKKAAPELMTGLTRSITGVF
jgi:Enterobacterial TraT complement resistance protein